jgi:hypothetical protein
MILPGRRYVTAVAFLGYQLTEQLREVCEKVLILEHKDIMVEEFQNLLDLDRTDGQSPLTMLSIADQQISPGCTDSYRVSLMDWRI